MNENTRRKDVEWCVGDKKTGSVVNWERASVAVLMDLRDELKRLNALLYCSNFLDIPHTLRKLERNTRKRRRAPAKAKR